ncbi:uroporphyrinogen decarboxylase family protein [Candidatus Poribacteria bacterium]
MNSRERLTRLFSGKDIDRVPIWLLFPYYPSGSYANIWEIPSYQPVLRKVYDHTDTIERRHFSMGYCFNAHPDIRHERHQFVKDGCTVSQRFIRCRDVELRSSVTKGKDRSFIEHLIEDVKDLDKLLSMPYRQATPEVDWFFEKQERFGNRGLMAVDLGDPLSIFHSLCSETDFVLWCYEETQQVMDFLDVMVERTLSSYRYLLQHGVADVYWISGSEFACPPMLPPDYFNRLVVRYTKPLVDLVHSYGKKTMIHCHGKIGEVLSGVAAIGSDAHHPIEGPPMGDCTLTQVHKFLGRDVILAGNIQLGDLWSKTEEEMEDLVRRTIQEGKKGSFILAMTGGPSAPEISERVVNNYLRIIETALDSGLY